MYLYSVMALLVLQVGNVHFTAMKIHISQESREFLAQTDDFLIEKRGIIEVKVLEKYFLMIFKNILSVLSEYLTIKNLSK